MQIFIRIEMKIPSDAVLRERPVITVRITSKNFSDVFKWVKDHSSYRQSVHTSLSVSNTIVIDERYIAGEGDYVIYDVVSGKFSSIRAHVFHDLSNLQVKDWTFE